MYLFMLLTLWQQLGQFLHAVYSFLYVLNIAHVFKYLRCYYVEKVKHDIHTVVGLLRHGEMLEMEKS